MRLDPFLPYCGLKPALLNQLGFWSKLTQRMGVSPKHNFQRCRKRKMFDIMTLTRSVAARKLILKRTVVARKWMPNSKRQRL